MRTILILSLLIAGCTKETISVNKSTSIDNSIQTLTIGQHFEGGIIFYIDSTGEHGLISDTADLKAGTWWNGIYTATGALKKKIGYGDSNTEKIVSSQGDSGHYAARRCYKSTVNGYTDWFMPSRDELNELYLHKSIIGNFVTNGIYWSSTEDGGNYQLAWLQYFSGGAQGNQFKNFTANVRAIRKF